MGARASIGSYAVRFHRLLIIAVRSRNDYYFSALLTTLECRISDAETQIGAGLIEEVIQVAEGELQLVEVMKEHKV